MTPRQRSHLADVLLGAIISVACGLAVIGMSACVAAYAQGTATGDASPSWAEHLDVVKALIIALLGLVVWYEKRSRDQISKQFSAVMAEIHRVERSMSERIDSMHRSGEKRDLLINTLWTEHKLMKEACGFAHRRHDDVPPPSGENGGGD